ncbi:response regulator [Pseudemcibacter aquimaris]|uniref:response regulator n=1 Tax=Pseudemcibacter aquimaris TaxID=2857064 RepID=UPI0020133C70|nr:response regulator [Pseudemcibacter aquimaris]MCC3861620.1 response regulator [Pseudemcibacter aquimaris]WDU58389.1 response regulator [Pseudemcibacter aquimaris]
MARILIAEDEVAVRTFICRALKLRGHETIGVADGGAAVVELENGEYDLLLTDIIMPVMDGISLALKVTAEYPELPILMMTGFVHEKQKAKDIGGLTHNIISKPFSLDEICHAVDEVLTASKTLH